MLSLLLLHCFSKYKKSVLGFGAATLLGFGETTLLGFGTAALLGFGAATLKIAANKLHFMFLCFFRKSVVCDVRVIKYGSS